MIKMVSKTKHTSSVLEQMEKISALGYSYSLSFDGKARRQSEILMNKS